MIKGARMMEGELDVGQMIIDKASLEHTYDQRKGTITVRDYF